MSLKDTLQRDLIAAVHSRDDVRKRPLRVIMALIHEAEAHDATTENPVAREVPDAQILELIESEADRRGHTVFTYERRGFVDHARFERAELAVVERYLDDSPM